MAHAQLANSLLTVVKNMLTYNKLKDQYNPLFTTPPQPVT